MSFYIVDVDNEGFKLYDASGNAIGGTLDGAVYRLLVDSKTLLVDASGNVVAISPDVSIPAGTRGVLALGEDAAGIARTLRTETDGELRTVLYDANGVAMAVQGGVAVPANTRALLVAGEDAGGVARFLSVSAQGAAKNVLYDDANDVAMAVANTVSRPANTRGLIAAGVDVADVVHFLQTDGEGVLKVSTQPPQPPPGTTEFVLAVPDADLEIGAPPAYHETVSGGGTAPIGSGVELYLQLFTGGAAGDPSERGSRVDVLWREGAGPTDHPIERLYLSGQTVTEILPDVHEARDGTALVGNGSNTYLVIRRYRLSNADQEVDAIVRGYTE